MDTYFCHKCGAKRDILSGNINIFNPTGNIYELDKYFKHYNKPNTSDLVSIFDSSGNERYRNYVVNTLASGCIEEDIFGRINIIWVAGRRTGFMYKNGQLQGDTDAVKVVLHTDPNKIHAFPTGSANLSKKRCLMCGNDIVY